MKFAVKQAKQVKIKIYKLNSRRLWGSENYYDNLERVTATSEISLQMLQCDAAAESRKSGLQTMRKKSN